MSKIVIVLLLVFSPYNGTCAKAFGDSATEEFNDAKKYEIHCPGGFRLSSSICLPLGYRNGELPQTPTEINTAIAINNIREIDDKKMTVSIEFHPQLVWADKRIVTNFTDEERTKGKVLNSIYLQKVWKYMLFKTFPLVLSSSVKLVTIRLSAQTS
jgi:hypothetical protein